VGGPAELETGGRRGAGGGGMRGLRKELKKSGDKRRLAHDLHAGSSSL
jgi:hypothetical protein